MKPLSQKDIGRFWSRVDVGDGCWDWLGYERKGGYGGIKFGHTAFLAHRVAHFLHTGELPTVVRHTCDRKSCVNPAHLLGGEQADNMREAAERGGRWTKITNAQAREIFESKLPDSVLAPRYGISKSMISLIRSGKARRHATAR